MLTGEVNTRAACYFDSETIDHCVTLENAIVRDGAFAGAVYTNKVDETLVPVLPEYHRNIQKFHDGIFKTKTGLALLEAIHMA